MPTAANVVTGAVKLLGLPDTACFTSFGDMLLALEQYLVLEIPNSITNVTVGNIEPSDSERDNIWFRYNSSGTFIGEYVFSGGAWVQVSPVPQGIFKMYGDSNNIPPGFILADNTNPNLSPGDVAVLQATWNPPGAVGPWTIFDVTYEGA